MILDLPVYHDICDTGISHLGKPKPDINEEFLPSMTASRNAMF